MKEKLSPKEALFGFVGWLTTREEVVTISRKHNAAGLANLLEDFCSANNLEEIKEDWYKNLIHPKN